MQPWAEWAQSTLCPLLSMQSSFISMRQARCRRREAGQQLSACVLHQLALHQRGTQSLTCNLVTACLLSRGLLHRRHQSSLLAAGRGESGSQVHEGLAGQGISHILGAERANHRVQHGAPPLLAEAPVPQHPPAGTGPGLWAATLDVVRRCCTG